MDCKANKWILIKGIFLIFLAALLISCHTIHPVHQTSVQQIEDTMQNSVKNNKALTPKLSTAHLPSGVNSTLLPPLSRYVNPARQAQPRFDVAANKVPAREFFMGLVAGTQYNMIIHPSITGTISLSLKNVTVRQAMDAVHDIYGYEYRRNSYGFEVLPPQLETQLFHINYLDIQRTGRSYTQLTTGQVSNKVGTVTVGGSGYGGGAQQGSPVTQAGSTDGGLGTISSIETKSEMQFWKTIEKTIQGMLPRDDAHSVTINA